MLEPAREIGFAGRRVIEANQDVRNCLKIFSKVNFIEYGALDMIVDRCDLRKRVAGLLFKLTNTPLMMND